MLSVAKKILRLVLLNPFSSKITLRLYTFLEAEIQRENLRQSTEVQHWRAKVRELRLEKKELARDIRNNQEQTVFFKELYSGNNLEACLTNYVRQGHSKKYRLSARKVAQTIYSSDETKEIGALLLGTFLVNDGFEESPFEYFSQLPKDKVLKFCPKEYFTALFAKSSDRGVDELEEYIVQLGDHLTHKAYLDLISLLVKHRKYDSFDKHVKQLSQLEIQNPQLQGESLQLLKWYELRMSNYKCAPLENNDSSEVNIALMDYKLLDRKKSSSNRGDYVQTLAAIANLCRFTNIEFRGDLELVDLLNLYKEKVHTSCRNNSITANVHPVILDRDFSSGREYPPDTWLICNGWFMHRNYKGIIDFPFPENINPLFISFHINDPTVLDDQVAKQLKQYEPIGCRDWTTVYRLREFNIKCFFSGCLTMTIGQIFPSADNLQRKRIASVESAIDQTLYQNWESEIFSQVGDYVRDFNFVEGIKDAYAMLKAYLDFSRVQTSRLHCYLPCRSMGLPVDFRPRNTSDIRFEGLLELDQRQYSTLRTALENKLHSVFQKILLGSTKEEVIKHWRDICQADVEYADEYCKKYDKFTTQSSLNIDSTLENLHHFSIPRTESNYEEKNNQIVNLAFALDENLADILPIVLESVCQNTSSPLNVHILYRGLKTKYLVDLASQFPAISFELFDFSQVDYGSKVRMLSHTSISTMDRLYLPLVLSNIQKILYLDIDILVNGDVAELYHLDIDEYLIAGKHTRYKQWDNLIRLVTRASLYMEPEDSWNMRRMLHDKHSLYSHTFNAGVILMNLKKMREDAFTQNYVFLVHDCKMNDQDILNLYAAGQVKELPLEWNYVPNQDFCKAPKLIHWAGPNKPWLTDYVLEKEKFITVRNQLEEKIKKKT